MLPASTHTHLHRGQSSPSWDRLHPPARMSCLQPPGAPAVTTELDSLWKQNQAPLEAEPSCPWALREHLVSPQQPGAGQEHPKSSEMPKTLAPGLPMPFHSQPALFLLCTDWDPAPSCSAQDLLPATLATAWVLPALGHSDRTKGPCCFPGEPWRRALGCPSVLAGCHIVPATAQPPPCAPRRAKAPGRDEASAGDSTATFVVGERGVPQCVG